MISGGIKGWLVDRETGFLVKRGDIEKLSNRISNLLQDVTLARRRGEKGRERAERYFRRNTHLERLLAVYEEKVSKREAISFLK